MVAFLGESLHFPNNGIFNGDINLNNTNSPVLSENKGNAPVTFDTAHVNRNNANIPERSAD